LGKLWFFWRFSNRLYRDFFGKIVVFLAILESPLQGFFWENGWGFSGDSRIASTGIFLGKLWFSWRFSNRLYRDFFGELGVSESGELFTEQNPL
jgi:hypothetical protein